MWPHRNRPRAAARLHHATGTRIGAPPGPPDAHGHNGHNKYNEHAEHADHADHFDAPPASRSGSRPLLMDDPSSEGDDQSKQPRWFWTWDRRSQRAVSVLLAGLAVVVAWWWWSGQPSESVVAGEVTVSEGVPIANDDDATGGVPTSGSVIVHVVGKVAEPGIVELPAGSRVIDAIEAVGGARNDRALETVNLARVVVDGEQIIVGAPAAGAGAAKVSINSADAAALEQLPGVGPVIAERIVAWRTKNGPFRTVAELAEISGIGPSMIERIEDEVRM